MQNHYEPYSSYYAVSALLVRKLFKCRLTGDYSDEYDLTEEDVMPLMEPTERLIAFVSDLAKAKLAE